MQHNIEFIENQYVRLPIVSEFCVNPFDECYNTLFHIFLLFCRAIPSIYFIAKKRNERNINCFSRLRIMSSYIKRVINNLGRKRSLSLLVILIATRLKKKKVYTREKL